MPALPNPQTLAVRALAAVLVAAVSFGAGWMVNGWRLGERVAQYERDAAQEKRDAIAAALAERDELAGKLAAQDKTATANLKRLTDENEALRARVRTGRVVVRVPGASCPADVPQASAGRSVDTGGGAVLNAEAGQAVFDFRADALRVGAKLAACQDAVRSMTGQ